MSDYWIVTVPLDELYERPVDPVEVDGHGDDLTLYCHGCDLLVESLTVEQAKVWAGVHRNMHGYELH